MEYKGYTGKILKIDLTARRTETIPLSEQLAEDYIGGGGIAAYFISEMSRPEIDPYHENNPLVFMTGPLRGMIVPWSRRHGIATIPPLARIWGEAYAGGTWG
jgi:aldehyde:ferredoxin oxidoreductase